ncbi:hypothetical protein EDB19DRAFT_1835111 [Suillus lakei]|nr:hypothetical protein EDB19DRAFT_1835111 [Suillus lakei]
MEDRLIKRGQTKPHNIRLICKIRSRQLREPPFSFYLKHYVNQANRISTAPGGVLTLGGTNSSLFKGSIECLNLTAVTAQGKTITIDPPSSLTAIDTGTTLIGAPTSITSLPAIGKASCDTDVTVHISFSGTNGAISRLDMDLSTLNDIIRCVGGAFDIGILVSGLSSSTGSSDLNPVQPEATALMPLPTSICASSSESSWPYNV